MSGIELIAQERQRQIEKEGWTAKHDDEHASGELALAAACYATPHHHRDMCASEGHPYLWPLEWGARWWKPAPITIINQSGYEGPSAADRIRELAKAGALIAAEIDRLRTLRPDGPARPMPVYDGDESWTRIDAAPPSPSAAQPSQDVAGTSGESLAGLSKEGSETP